MVLVYMFPNLSITEAFSTLTLKVHSPAGWSYQTVWLLGELALMALSGKYCDLDPEMIEDKHTDNFPVKAYLHLKDT